MHNPKAGDQQHKKKQLVAALTKAGHGVIYQSTKKPGYEKALKEPTDLVLVAGGDGTVGKVAARLVDTGLPLAVVPLGTANNLARTLGFTASPEEIIARLEDGTKRTFDAGVARGPWGERYFFESVGGGLLADYVQSAGEDTKTSTGESKEQEITRHVLLLRQMLHDYKPRPWRMKGDGRDVSGKYLLWEAMNIRSVGPALFLAPTAVTKDGQFDFVCVRERDREQLMKYLDARLAGKKSKFPLRMRRLGKLRVTWSKSTLHLDDKLWPEKDETPQAAKIEITMKPSALIVLEPNNKAG